VSCFAVVAALCLVGSALLFNSDSPPPQINGVYIPGAKSLQSFSLIDHNNNLFTNSQLKGKWHILSYGYTHCPDICPMTLITLARATKQLRADDPKLDLGLLFYSIDPVRDTIEHLAEYLPWFHESLLGLTRIANQGKSSLAFEKSLGMVSIVDSSGGDGGYYNVSHGVVMYVLNPEGKLQAILKPSKNKDGSQHFSMEQIYQDFKSVRSYTG